MKSILQAGSAIWRYRGFVLGSVKREFQSKYQNALLGAVWALVQPLAMILVYTLIFSQLMKTKLVGVEMEYAYSVYLCAGLFTWGLFAEMLTKSQSMFLENANLLKKVHFPVVTLPVILMGNALVNFSIVFALYLGFLAISGNWPGAVLWSFLPVLLVQLMLSLGLCLVLGVLNVFFRDVGQFMGVFIQLWFWVTPIVYPLSIVPLSVQTYLSWNPMLALVNAYHAIFVNQQAPDFSSLMWPASLGFVLCWIGWRLLVNHAGEMVDEL